MAKPKITTEEEALPQHLREIGECWGDGASQTAWELLYKPKRFKKESQKLYGELCLKAVKLNGRALKHVPEKFRTAEVCLEAVKEDGWALEYLPKKLRTAELCLEAVKQNGEALEYVPKELRTAELCLEAVKQDGEALQFVPKSLEAEVLRAHKNAREE